MTDTGRGGAAEREVLVTDTGRGAAVKEVIVCDNKCGCTVPCNGGSGCRCTGGSAIGGGDHMTCPCGEHCECNPCSCAKTVAAGSSCKCGTDCTCASCHT